MWKNIRVHDRWGNEKYETKRMRECGKEKHKNLRNRREPPHE
jgi:hypothetical protein